MSIFIKDIVYQNQGKKILNGVTLEVKKGEYCFFIGETGSGKTTILELAMGLLEDKSISGKIEVFGRPMIGKKNKRENQRNISYVFQRCEAQFFETNIEKELSISGDLDKGKEILNTLGLDYERIKSKSPFELSGGEKRKVAITIALLKNPELLLLDEPTMGLDGKSSEELMAFLKKLNEKGMTIIQTTHIMEEVLNYGTKAVVIKDGKVEYEGKDVFSEKKILKESRLEVPFKRQLLDKLLEKGIDIKEEEVEDYLLKELC